MGTERKSVRERARDGDFATGHHYPFFLILVFSSFTGLGARKRQRQAARQGKGDAQFPDVLFVALFVSSALGHGGVLAAGPCLYLCLVPALVHRLFFAFIFFSSFSPRNPPASHLSCSVILLPLSRPAQPSLLLS